MAHEVEGKIYSLKQKSWHGNDIISEDVLSSAEIIKLVNLDYIVEKQPIYLGSNDVIPNHYANVRMDTGKALGVVKDKYQIVQNTEAFEFFDSVIGKDYIQYETAGILKEGKKVFVTAKMKNGMKVNGKDEHDLYLIFLNDHSGTSPVRIMLSSVRLVCANTMVASIKDAKRANTHFAIKHTKSYKNKIDTAEQVLRLSKQTFEQQKDFFEKISKIQLKDNQVSDLALKLICDYAELDSIGTGADISEVLSTRKFNTYNKILNSYHNPNSQQSILGTGYGFLNGVTYFTSHEMYKDKEDSINGHLFGGALDLQQKAVDLILAY